VYTFSMHELPFVEGIIKTVTSNLPKKKNVRVSEIRIVVGDLSSIVDDSLMYYFSKIRKPKALSSATLTIIRTPAIAQCESCHSNLPVQLPLEGTCKKCGSKDIRIDGGKELFIESADITV
jgi:hydrogenase nickel incorporation protein HypA/HybF